MSQLFSLNFSLNVIPRSIRYAPLKGFTIDIKNFSISPTMMISAYLSPQIILILKLPLYLDLLAQGPQILAGVPQDILFLF